MESVKTLATIVFAPFWICLFVFTDIIVPLMMPIFKGLAGAFKRLSEQQQAEWATFQTLKKRGLLKRGGIPIAAIKKWRWHKVYTSPESSVVMIAPKGQGKSQSLIAMVKDITLRKEKPCLILHDPAGEIFQHTQADLDSAGYTTGVIDLYDVSKGINYDPLSFPDVMDTDHFDQHVKLLAESIVTEEPGNKQAHFLDFTRLLVREAITSAIHDRKGDIAHCVFQIINTDERAKLVASIKRRGNAEDALVIETFAKMTAKSGPEGNSMFSTTLRKLETFRLSVIRKVSLVQSSRPSRPRGWTWDDIFDHDKPSAIFIKTGLMPGNAEYVRVTMSNAVNTVRRRWDATGKPLKHGLVMIGDEMQKLGFAGAMLDANVELRKAKVVNVFVFPSLSDVKRIYGDYADTLINGCELVAFGGAKESSYYEELSKLIGDRRDFSLSESDGRTSRHEIITRLAKPAWLRSLPFGELVAIVGDLNLHAGKLFEIKKGKPRYR